MRRDIRAELRKSRELLRILLRGRNCFFCRKRLLTDEYLDQLAEAYPIGNGDGPPLQAVRYLTIHHENEDHWDNRHTNHKLSHSTCHRRWTATKRWREAKQKGSNGFCSPIMSAKENKR